MFYSKYENSFYVYAKEPKDFQDKYDIDKTVLYITRYANCLVMAESRIIEYNFETKMVHWYYNRHKDNDRVDVTEHIV